MPYLTSLLEYQLWGVAVKVPLTFLAKAIVIFLFVRIVTFVIRSLFKQNLRRKYGEYDETTLKSNAFVLRISVAAVYLIGIVAFLSLIPGMEKISSSILASAGIFAMAIGLASQEALSNLIGGFFIIFSRPFRVGDFIKVGDDVTGVVDEITLRHTVIRSLDNRMVLIPNRQINSSVIVNSTITETQTCNYIEIGVSYTVNLDRAIEVMREEIMQHPSLIDRRSKEDKKKNVPQVVIRVTNLGDSSITLRAWAWSNTPAEGFAMKCDLLKKIKERFDDEKIEIPYPYFNQIVMKQ
jgi:small-conductance mechanosensitive channel